MIQLLSRPRTLLCILIAICTAPALHGQIRLARIFDDHMVLQRGKPIQIWGWGEPRTSVTIRFHDQQRQTRIDETGAWAITLDSMEANATGSDLIVEGAQDPIVVSDVLVGEVWICGGQSNMEWPLRASRDADIEIPCADDPGMRFIRLPKIARSEPQQDYPPPRGKGKDGWRICTPAAAENCTGVGYHFGRRLRRSLRVPVGLIDVSWGGTMAQHWVPKPILRKISEVDPYFETFEERLTAWIDGGREDGARQRLETDLKLWEAERAKARAAGKREPGKPRAAAYESPAIKGHPGAMYDGMIAPLAGLSVRGALFYQGENNSFTEGWKPFPRTYPAVIAAWRAAFRDPALPMGLIQIAGWSNRRSMTYDMNHHTNIVREVQFDTWKKTANTGLIVTFDTNSNQSIHPGRKRPVGERTARWALSEVYGIEAGRGGKPLEWRGPVYASMEVMGRKIVVGFEEQTARGLRLDQDAELGFYVAGENREFHVARARVIKGNRVEIWCDAVPAPVAARYAWSNLPLGSLMNARELPAYPFRSDSWPMVPHQSKGSYQRPARD